MPIRKRGASWQVDVQAHGRRARCTVSTKALAVEAERKLREDLERVAIGLRPSRTLADALAEWLTTSAPALKSHRETVSKARQIRAHLNVPLERIAEAASAIITAGQGKTAATINRRLALLRRLGNLAFRWGWTDQPLGARVQLLPEHQDRHVYLMVDQVAELVRHATLEGTKDAIWLAACTGLRRGELLSLTPANWRGNAIWLETSKSGRPRLVPVPPDAAHICERLPLRVSDGQLRRDFDQAREAAGMPHVRFHDLRHTFASWAVEAGVDLRVLKDLMGHSTMQMTSRYAHLQDAQLVAAVQRMAKSRVTHASQAGRPGKSRIRK